MQCNAMQNNKEREQNKFKLILTYSAVAFVTAVMVVQYHHSYINWKNVDLKGENGMHLKIMANQSFKYRFKNNITGLSFTVPNKYMNMLKNIKAGLLPTITLGVLQKFVFVTAASSNHVLELWASLSRIQHVDPGRMIYVYDIGLSKVHIKQLKSLCYVKYVKFKFSQYPKFVRDLHFYAWKPLIIMELLQTEDAVLWLDTSVRLFSKNYTNIFQKIQTTDGILLFAPAGGSIYAVTHPKMYIYIPTDINSINQTLIFASTMLVLRTEKLYQMIFRWYFLCSLQKMCIAPTKRRICDQSKHYLHCHRYDMSLINLLLANMYHFDVNRYTYIQRPGNQVIRHAFRGKHKINFSLRKIKNNVC